MSDETDDTSKPEPSGKTEPAKEAKPVLSLDMDFFAPAWARGASDTQKYQSHSGKGDHTNSRDRKGGDRRGPPRPGGNRPGGGGPRPNTGAGRPDGSRPRDVNTRDRNDRDARFQGGQQFQRREPLPLEVRFVPSQRAIGQLAKQIRSTHKAYPLMQVAAYLMGNAANYLVRLQVRRDVEHFSLFQCTLCKSVGLTEQALVGHIMTRHLPDIMDVKEEEGEPFSGEFPCVAQCGMSGVLLGPPNHHSYAEKVREVHATRFPDMSVDNYRGRIKMVHDKALVDQWKEESRKRTSYRVTAGESVRELKSWSDVEAYIARNRRADLIEETRRTLVPAPVAQQIEDRDITGTIEYAFRREAQFPLHMSLALRSSLRHMGFTLFRLDRERVFVASVEPLPLDVAHAIPSVQKMVEYLNKHPRTKRDTVLTELQKTAGVEAGELLTTLTWLIERGHIIELSDTALMLPSDAGFTSGEHERADAESPAAAVDAENVVSTVEPEISGTTEAIEPIDPRAAEVPPPAVE